MTPCPNCGWKHHSPKPIKVHCRKCGTEVCIACDTQTDLPLTTQPKRDTNTDTKKELGRQAWKRLHELKDWSPQVIQNWLESVPSISCDCRAFAREHVENNPPPYGDLAACQRWSFDFHCIVDKKTGDAPMSWEAACLEWDWQAG